MVGSRLYAIFFLLILIALLANAGAVVHDDAGLNKLQLRATSDLEGPKQGGEQLARDGASARQLSPGLDRVRNMPSQDVLQSGMQSHGRCTTCNNSFAVSHFIV